MNNFLPVYETLKHDNITFVNLIHNFDLCINCNILYIYTSKQYIMTLIHFLSV